MAILNGRKETEMENANKYKWVAFRVDRQRIARNEETGTPYVKNGWFVYAQIEANAPDAIALNWTYVGEYKSEEEAKAKAFELREMEMFLNDIKYCPIYNNGGYAYEGSY